jgi:NhaP-type Na+/H+ or K+/H+ antiporter
MRQVERSHRSEGAVPDESAVQPLTAHPSSLTAHKVLLFNEQLERISEVAVVILIGSMLSISELPIDLLWFAPILFLVVRPLAVGIGLARSGVPRYRRWLMSWFGIRGIGSIYYLMYAIQRGVREDEAASIAGLVLGVVAISVIVHGITVTPLMKRYERRTEDRST